MTIFRSIREQIRTVFLRHSKRIVPYSAVFIMMIGYAVISRSAEAKGKGIIPVHEGTPFLKSYLPIDTDEKEDSETWKE